RATGSDTEAPGSESSFSTLTTSPTATLYCLPPVLTIAYVAIVSSALRRRPPGVVRARVLGAGPLGVPPAANSDIQSLATTAQGYVTSGERVKPPPCSGQGP